jgi:hypothetical protein
VLSGVVIKFLLFVASGGLLYREISEETLGQKRWLHWMMVLIYSTVAIYYGGDFLYHVVTKDQDSAGFPKFLAKVVGVESMLDTFSKCPDSADRSTVLSDECRLKQEIEDDNVIFKRAKAAHTIAAYENYKKSCKLCAHSHDADAAIQQVERSIHVRQDNNLFEEAKRIGSLASYMQYRKECRRCAHMEQTDIQIKAYATAASVFQSVRNSGRATQLSRAGRFLLTTDFALDTESTLAWRRCAIGQNMKDGNCVGQAEIFKIEQAHEHTKRFVEDGLTGWRPATAAELRSILEASAGNISTKKPYIDEVVFPNLGRDNYNDTSYQGIAGTSCEVVEFDKNQIRSTACALRWPILVVLDSKMIERLAVDAQKTSAKKPDRITKSNVALEKQTSERASFFLQVGSFQNQTEAEKLRGHVALLGLESFVEPRAIPERGQWYRVRLGPYTDVEELNRLRDLLKQNGIDSALVKVTGP